MLHWSPYSFADRSASRGMVWDGERVNAACGFPAEGVRVLI
jgi:hypothetical protein